MITNEGGVGALLLQELANKLIKQPCRGVRGRAIDPMLLDQIQLGVARAGQDSEGGNHGQRLVPTIFWPVMMVRHSVSPASFECLASRGPRGS